LGNRFRGDDAAGLDVVIGLEEMAGVVCREHSGETLDLLNLWTGAEAVILVDAVDGPRDSGVSPEPGTLHRFEVDREPLPVDGDPASTHLFGLRETVELARTLGVLPPRLVLLGVTGARFSMGDSLSPEVETAIPRLRDLVRREIEEALGCTHADVEEACTRRK